MDFTIQETRAAASHQRAVDESMTCIDCHQGIAHDLAPGYLEEYEHVVETLAQSSAPVDRAVIDVASIKSFLGVAED
jgi:cytochrome c-type protein NapC